MDLARVDNFSEACEIIAGLPDLPLAMQVADQARAMRAYHGATAAGLEAAAMQLVAERRVAHFLGEAENGRPSETSLTEKFPGLSHNDRHRLRQLRSVSMGDVIAYAEEQKRLRKWPTRSGVLREKRQEEAVEARQCVGMGPEEASDCLVSLADAVRAGDRPPFQTFYVDPPWPYQNQGTRGATGNHYKVATMSLEDLHALPVDAMAADESHLHLWTTKVFLREAFDVIDAWGFTYKSIFTWVKPQLGMGNYWRSSSEFMLLGTRGGCPFAEHSADTKDWLELPRTQHSAKPIEIRRLIERVSPGQSDPSTRLELFARNTAPGWVSWGNEVERDLFNAEAFAP